MPTDGLGPNNRAPVEARHHSGGEYAHGGPSNPDLRGVGLRGRSRVALSEGRAIARQAGLILRPKWRRAAHRRPLLLDVEAPRVVLVHGFMAGAPVFNPLRRRIEDELRMPTVAFGYPSIGSFERTVERLAECVHEIAPEGASVVLLGHSLGGVLARAYVAQHAATGRTPSGGDIARIVTVSTPHLGTTAAAIAPGGLGAAIRPGSAELRALNAEDVRVPIHAIAGALDTTVPPSSALAAGNSRQHTDVVPGVGHNGILYDRASMDVILAALAGR